MSINAESAVGALGGDEIATRIASDALNKVSVLHDALELAAFGDVPDDDGAIDGGAEEARGVGGPGDVADVLGVTAEAL